LAVASKTCRGGWGKEGERGLEDASVCTRAFEGKEDMFDLEPLVKFGFV
jgi:hypothetical protein